MQRQSLQLKGDKTSVQCAGVSTSIEAMEASGYIKYCIVPFGRVKLLVDMGMEKTIETAE